MVIPAAIDAAAEIPFEDGCEGGGIAGRAGDPLEVRHAEVQQLAELAAMIRAAGGMAAIG